MLFPSAAAILH